MKNHHFVSTMSQLTNSSLKTFGRIRIMLVNQIAHQDD